MTSTIQQLKGNFSGALGSLKSRGAELTKAAEREAKLQSIRANSASELRALRELNDTFAPLLAALAAVDLTPFKNSGMNTEDVQDAPAISAALAAAISANQGVVEGTTDPATLLDSPQPVASASDIQVWIEKVVSAAAKLGAA